MVSVTWHVICEHPLSANTGGVVMQITVGPRLLTVAQATKQTGHVSHSNCIPLMKSLL
jgi:hypothetical protein